MEKDEEHWKRKLTPEQYKVLREGGTELPFTGKLLHNRGEGIYRCGACGNPIFRSERKFDSGTGWPSFDEAIGGSVELKEDKSLGMRRVEARCSKCGSHLGHLFEDGPTETGKRYCINSCALGFSGKEEGRVEKAAFGAGCFWRVEEEFRKVEGVLETAVGYMGGEMESPTYEDVCTGRTGHAETVLVEFDPSKVSYGELLERFWRMHDPTTKNRQGLDIGPQYRSVVFYYDGKQRREAEESRRKLQESGRHSRPVVTEIRKAGEFYRAEEYHQKYLMKKGGGSCSI